MKKLSQVLAVSLAVSASAFAEDRPTAEQLLEKVTAAYAGLKSIEGEAKQMIQTSSVTTTGVVYLVMERMKKDDRIIERDSCTLSATEKTWAGLERTREAKVVNDGTYTWSEDRVSEPKEVTVTKMSSDAPGGFTAQAVLCGDLARTWEQFHLKVVGEDTLDGRKMYLLEGQLGTEFKPSRQKVWVGQDDLLIHKTVNETTLKAGDPPLVCSTEWVSLKINPPVDPKLFVYTPPAGAKVEDKTKP